MKKNSMINYLKNLQGNPKYCILTEPLWFIPYSLYAPYATIFMYSLGVTDIQIGFIISFGMVIQVIAAFFGGVLTDKLGRRMTTILADLISWSIPCLIWAFAQNFWWFLIAAMFNSIWQISNISWSALLVEDSKESDLVYAYSWINIASVLSVFVSPIAFVLINKFDTVIIVRYLYMFSFISMTIKFLILFIKGHETEQGVKRMEETKNESVGKLILGYKDVFKKLIQSPAMRFTLFLLLTYNIAITAVNGNFFGLYVTQRLGLEESFISIFQMCGAVVTLIFMFTLQSKLSKLPVRHVMLAGYIIFIVTNTLLILAPIENVLYVICYTLLNSVAVACVAPRKDSLSATFIDKKERSRVNALMYMIMIGFTSPFGIFIGWLSTIDRRLPFILNILIFVICFVAMFNSNEVKKLDKASSIT
ncbi:MAG: MFS transporter [Clostridia bacterium]